MKLGMNMLLWSTDVTGPEYGPTFEMLADAGYEGDRGADLRRPRRARVASGSASGCAGSASTRSA